MIIDMHTHTLYSDGLYSPKELIDLAIKKKLSGIAITDHDTIDGLEEAVSYASRKEKFTVVPGIEFGCEYNDKEVHILGYFIDYSNTQLLNISKKLKESRVRRGERIVEKLNSLGMDINLEDIKKITKDDYIGRPHIARALIEKGYVGNIKEAFEKYLVKGSPTYAERFRLSIVDSINLIKEVNGISVLAHPALIDDEKIIKHAIDLGVDGIECYHSKHSKSDIEKFLRLANENNLIITGGSDYHGDEDTLGDCYIDFRKSPILMGRVRYG